MIHLVNLLSQNSTFFCPSSFIHLGSDDQLSFEIAQKLDICLPDNTLSPDPGSGENDLFFITILCFEALLCSLAIAKAVIARIRLGWSAKVSTLDFLIRDSVVYFVA